MLSLLTPLCRHSLHGKRRPRHKWKPVFRKQSYPSCPELLSFVLLPFLNFDTLSGLGHWERRFFRILLHNQELASVSEVRGILFRSNVLFLIIAFAVLQITTVKTSW
jgi:hypothetical protein